MPHRSPRYLRMFTRWFNKNGHRFLVPVALKKINARKTIVVFPQHPPAIEIYLRRGNLSVGACYKDQFMDFLLDLDCVEIETSDGYQCGFCEMPRQTWPTLEDMYADHLYEPFLEWVNEKLLVATGVAMYDIGGGRWAELIGIKKTEPSLEYLKLYVPFSTSPSGRETA